MVSLNRIYTRTGDEGFTGLVGGARISKTSPRVWSYGDIDELNSHLGMCRTLANSKHHTGGFIGALKRLYNRSNFRKRDQNIILLIEMLARIQNELFDLGSELATPPGASWDGMPHTSQEQVTRLESWIDQLNANLPTLKSFVLPGGDQLNAQLHIARTVCRRAERSVLALKHHEEVPDVVVRYLNRLSDLLFVMSRYVSFCFGNTEYLWVPGGAEDVTGQS